jgi:glycerol-3-phosphate dehydrogenase subunit B
MTDGRVIVVGGGAAGVWAALAARKAGASVALVRQAPGASAVSSGCLDLASAQDLAGQPAAPVAAAEAIARTRTDHPYAALRSGLASAVERTAAFLGDVHRRLGIRGAAGRNLLLTTPFGNVKETWLAQGPIARGDLLAWGREARIGVVGLANRTAFDAHAVAAGLVFTGRIATALAVDFPVNPAASLPELARQIDDPAGRHSFVQAVVRAARTAGVTHVLVPTAGFEDPNGLLDAIENAGMTGAGEIMGVPPSVPGLRFERDLGERLAESGITIITGSVHDATISRGSVKQLMLDDGRTGDADAFVLATGRFLGGGIRHEGVFRETVFGLPVFVDRQDVADKWLGDLLDRNAAATQSALKAGVAVDASMRPVNDRGQVVYAHLFAAGSVIGGYDPAKDSTGLGVAAVTAMLAGEGAAAAALAAGQEAGTLDSYPPQARSAAGDLRP